MKFSVVTVNFQLSARKELRFVSGLLGGTSLLTRILPKSAFLYHRKHGPLQLYSLLTAVGLCARALAKLASLPMSESK